MDFFASERRLKYFFLTLISSACLIFILGLIIEPTEQEAYYWLWSKHPALSYFDHPPLQAWITSLLTAAFGDHRWVIRLPSTVGHILLLAFYWRWAKRKTNSSTAWWGLILLSSTTIILIANLIALPDVVMLPLAVLAADYAEQRRPGRTGIFLGLAMLAKWHAALLVPGIVACFLSRSPKRDWVGLTKVAAISLVLQLPVLIWNFENHWPSFYFHFVERQQRGVIPSRILFENSLNYLADQFVIAGFAWIFVIVTLVYAAKKNRENPIRSTQKKIAPLWIWIWPALVVFAVPGTRGEYRFYWTGWALIPLSIYLATKIEQSDLKAKIKIFRFSQATLVFNTLLLSFVLLLPVGAYLKPLIDRIGARYDLRLSPRGDFFGWKRWLNGEVLKGDNNLANTMFIASDFRIAARLEWAIKDQPPERRKMIIASGKQNEFAFWEHADPTKVAHVILVADNRRQPDAAQVSYCPTPVTWQNTEIRLLGEPVKEVIWAQCR